MQLFTPKNLQNDKIHRICDKLNHWNNSDVSRTFYYFENKGFGIFYHCEARLTMSQRGNPLESNLVRLGASARLPRRPKFTASSQWHLIWFCVDIFFLQIFYLIYCNKVLWPWGAGGFFAFPEGWSRVVAAQRHLYTTPTISNEEPRLYPSENLGATARLGNFV